jgi:hypothetical protein
LTVSVLFAPVWGLPRARSGIRLWGIRQRSAALLGLDGFPERGCRGRLYEISADTLKVCFDPEGKQRPTEFKSASGSQIFIDVHKHVKK